MQRYFPRLFSSLSLPVLLLWAGEALAYGVVVSDEAPSFSLLDFEPLTPLLSVPLFNAFLMLFTYGIRKFALKKTSTREDLYWPAALVNLLLLGGCGIFVIPAFNDIFVAFGAELPAPTLLIVSIPPVLWFLPFVAALILKYLVFKDIIFKGTARQPRLRVWLPIQLASLFLLTSLTFGLYVPIFRIGAVH